MTVSLPAIAALQVDALGDVVHDHQASDHVELARHQRCDCDVHGACIAGSRPHTELVQVVDAGVLADAVKLLARISTGALHSGGGQAPATEAAHSHLRVPRLDTVVEVNGEYTHVDGFDDVLVEVLEALVLRAFCSSEASRRAFWMAMPMYPASVSSSSTSSLERKSPVGGLAHAEERRWCDSSPCKGCNS